MFFTLIFAVLQGVSIVMLAPFLDALFGTGEAVIETVPVATDGFSIQALKDSIMSRAYGFLLEGTKTEALMRIVAPGGGTRTVDVQVNRLRQKIEPDPKLPRYLQTVRGQGYILRTD